MGHAFDALAVRFGNGPRGPGAQHMNARAERHDGNRHIVHILGEHGADGVEDVLDVVRIGAVELVNDFVRRAIGR